MFFLFKLKCIYLALSFHRNSAAETVEQQLLFVGSENGKLLAVRNLIKQVCEVHFSHSRDKI